MSRGCRGPHCCPAGWQGAGPSLEEDDMSSQFRWSAARFAALAVLALAAGAGCGSKANTAGGTPPQQTVTQTATPEPTPADQPPAPPEKTPKPTPTKTTSK